jgi:hypothetical protein
MDVYYDEHKRLLEYRWKDNSENMVEADYRKTVENLLQIIKTFEPKLLLGDSRQQNYPLSLDLQKWLAEEVLQQILQFGVERFAFVNSSNIFIEMAYEQVFSDALVYVEFFRTRDEAYSWLVENEKIGTTN